MIESSMIRMVRKLNLHAYIFIAVGVASYLIRNGYISFLPIEVRSAYFMKFDFISFFQIDDRTAFFVSLGLIGSGLAVLLFNYLRGEHAEPTDDVYLIDEKKILTNVLSSSPSPASKQEIKENEYKIKSLAEITRAISVGNLQITEEEKDSILEEIKKDILVDTANPAVPEVEEKYLKDIKRASQIAREQEKLEKIRLRLKREISVLGRRCNINLVAGVLTTITAMGILATIFFDTEVKFTVETFRSHFAAKFIFGLFVEISSLFFLTLYMYGLSQIKFFNNEITNIEMKFLSLDSAIRSRDEDLINSVVNEFSKTGRNKV
ncbi:MAG: hypothetical protein QNK32_09920 [Porticoccus sp.]|nr:hypothetical protein [Porticoccus sp.]